MPEMQIWAWGKPVLSDLDVDLDDLPPNIRLMGVYESFDQLPLDDVDFLFYTSALDGIPNVVMEGAQTGLPVVASAVGGVPEVITPETGYPVVDVDDPSAYVAAIKALLTDPAAATRRSAPGRCSSRRSGSCSSPGPTCYVQIDCPRFCRAGSVWACYRR